MAAAKPIVAIYVPGFLSSQLFLQTNPLANRYWVDRTNIIALNPGAMKLAADGVSPYSPFGRQMYFGEPYYYPNPFAFILEEQLPIDAEVFGFGYDFRLDNLLNANNLFAFIKPFLDAKQPVTLCCHSMGGIIAVLAKYAAFQQGYALGLIKIIAIGSPFHGSYDAPAVLDVASSPSDFMPIPEWAGFLSSLASYFGIGWPAFRHVFASWPSFAQLFPDPAYAPNDPYVATLFSGQPYGTEYSDVALPKWLSYALGTYMPTLNHALAYAAGGLVTVTGEGIQTRGAYLAKPTPSRKFQNATTPGDNIVPAWSVDVPAATKSKMFNVTHANLFATALQSGWLASTIKALNTASGPVNVPQVVPKENIMANLIPVASAPLANILTKMDGPRSKVVVVAFPNGIADTSCSILTCQRNYRLGDAAAADTQKRVGPPMICSMYIWSKTAGAWYAVPTVRQPHPIT